MKLTDERQIEHRQERAGRILEDWCLLDPITEHEPAIVLRAHREESPSRCMVREAQ